ncbi:hypothetical protein STEG23_003539, partial [Scotinomys teguina]
ELRRSHACCLGFMCMLAKKHGIDTESSSSQEPGSFLFIFDNINGNILHFWATLILFCQ